MSVLDTIAFFTKYVDHSLSDAPPYSVAKSHDHEEIITYTVTGPKYEKTRSYAFMILGIPWLIGGIMLLFTPNPTLTASPWIVYPVLLGGGAIACFQGLRGHRAATARHQIEINRKTRQAIYRRTKPYEMRRHRICNIACIPNHDNQLTCVIIENRTKTPLIVLGAFRESESDNTLTELIAEETDLPIIPAQDNQRLYRNYVKRFIASDKRALEKPIRTKRIMPKLTSRG